MMRRLWWAAVGLLLAACAPRPVVKGPGDPDAGVTIAWWGHSCFSVEDSAHRRILIDPFDESVGYSVPEVRADAVFITHDHFDHNYLRRGETPVVLRSTGVSTVVGIEVTGVPADHDDEGGRRHGPTNLYVWTMGGLRLAHLGDIGQKTLRPDQREALRGVDVLFVPVGGKTTVDATGARALVEEIRPRVVLPMHYGNAHVHFYEFDSPDPFYALMKNTVHLPDATFLLRRDTLPAETTVYVPAFPH